MLARRWSLIAGLAGVLAVAVGWLWVQVASLDAIVRGGDGPPSLVLLHGYGSKGRDWLQFEHRLQVPQQGRMVFPQGPLRGPLGARGWWWLNIEGHIPAGGGLPDFSTANPSGLKLASRLVRDLLDKQPGPVILGGFSQGAMVSAEIAFQTDQPLTALVLLGGATVNEAAWADGFAGRRMLPVFIAHGRRDRVLPFAAMERFQARLTEAGLDVTWFPFAGGHNLPDTVISALNEFLAGLKL